ncbi:MAG: hypothetical protein AAF467_15075 [Actinomycetota bacterium]
MTPNLRRTVAVLIGLMLALAACQSADSTAGGDAVPSEGATGDEGTAASSSLAEGTIDPSLLDALVDSVDRAYQRVDGVWPGYDPNDHPTVLAWRNDTDELIGAVAFNHPDPEALGPATEIDAEGRAFDSAHVIEEPAGEAADLLGAMQNFEFNRVIGGVDSFMMAVGGTDSFFDPTSSDYQSTLLHEMFHRYQEEAFTDGEGFQDVEGYAYTADNLELATLEERAVIAALGTDDDADRRTAAAHAAAIRLVRRAADDRVVLDDDQERFEGTARYVEHAFAADDDTYTFHDGNYARDLVSDPRDAYGIKDHYGFGRFYASGAAIYRLLDLLGAEDVVARTEAGDPPMTVLADTLGVADANAESLVAEARAVHDPDGELVALAADAAAQATEEGSVFDDEPISDDVGADGDGDTGEGDAVAGDGDGVAITDDELACLAEYGVDIESQDAVEIPDEAVEACFEPAG